MAVNFALLDAGPSIGQRFMMGQQEAQAEAERNMLRQAQMQQMAAQQENLMAQREQRALMADERRMKMDQAARRQEFLGGLAAKMEEGGYKLDRPTLGKMLQFGMQTGEDSLIKLATEGIKALDEEDLFRQESARFGVGGAPAAPAMPAAAAPVNALAQGFSREQVQNMLTSPSARIRSMGADIAKTLPPPERGYEPTELEKLINLQATLPPGSPQARAVQSRISMLTTREAPTPKEPSKAVEVVDPNDPSKIIFVSAEEAIRRNLTPARAQEGLTVKERQRRDASYPQATSAVKGFETKSEQFIKDLERLRDDPGLNQITGPVYGRTPSVSAAGSRAQALYDKIFAKGGFQALQDMREASKTGGALGNVSNEEGRRLEKSVVGGLDRKQNINDVKQGINDLIAEIRTSQARVRDAYDMTYEYRQGAGGAPSPATAPAAAPASATAFPTPPAAAVDALKRGAGTDAQFDAIFGPGAAARARGR